MNSLVPQVLGEFVDDMFAIRELAVVLAPSAEVLDSTRQEMALAELSRVAHDPEQALDQLINFAVALRDGLESGEGVGAANDALASYEDQFSDTEAGADLLFELLRSMTAKNRARTLLSGLLIGVLSSLELLVNRLMFEWYRINPNAKSTREGMGIRVSGEPKSLGADKAAEKSMNGGVEGWLEWFRSVPGINLNLMAPGRERELMEITARRHSLVHTGGSPSRSYKRLQPELPGTTRLHPPLDYVLKAVDTVAASGLILALASMAIVEPKAFGSVLLDQLGELATRSAWRATKDVASFGLTVTLPTEVRSDVLGYLVRSLQALDQPREAGECLATWDVSTASVRTASMKSCLSGNLDDAFHLVIEGLTSGGIRFYELERSPLFDALRTDTRYQDLRVLVEKSEI